MLTFQTRGRHSADQPISVSRWFIKLTDFLDGIVPTNRTGGTPALTTAITEPT